MAQVSTNQTTTYVLSASDPNLTIDSGVTIQTATTDGVDGYSGGAWNVTNDGGVTSNGAPGTFGIYLDGTSNTLTNNGSIAGAGGISFGSGGVLTNASSATIEANGSPAVYGISIVSGVHFGGAAGSVANYGTITSNGYGVGLDMGGSVTNYASGSITGAEDAIFFYGASGSLDNYGKLVATIDDGVGFFHGGTMINEVGGSVTCISNGGTGPSAVFFSTYPGTLENDGTMHGTLAGAYFDAGGNVVNGAKSTAALLQGDAYGVYMTNAAGSTSAETVTNYGTITGGTGASSVGVYIDGAAGSVTNAGTIAGRLYSVDFAFASASNRLVVDPGAIFNGLVAGGGGVLELAAGNGPGALSAAIGSAGSFQNFSALTVDTGASWTLSGASDSVATLTDNGNLVVTGALQATTIQLGGALEVASDTSSGSQIDFASGGKLIIDNAAAFGGPTLSGFGAGDIVDIHNFSATGTTASYNSATGVARITNGLQTATLDFNPATLGGQTLWLSSDGGTGVDVRIGVAPTISEVIHPNILQGVVHANNLALSGDVTGPHNFIDMPNFVASYGDLINAFGTNQQAAQNWYNTSEPIENRVETFDGLDYIASYGDLINAFKSAGSKQSVLDAGATHFIDAGYKEGRSVTFNGLDYIASYGDLINALGANGDAGAYHYIENGASEGRKTTFDGLDYIASYGDLINAFGANEQAGAAHFIENGYREGRTTTFNGLDYIASYGDLIQAFGANNDAGATHYIQNGHNEGRTTTFDGLDYIASYSDLIKALGANEQAGATHFIDNGYKEGRTTTFDGLAYIADYTDLMKAFGANNDAGATHYINNGSSEGRSTSFNVGAYESAHPDLIGRYASNDAFLTAYINTYKTTGTFLT